MAYRSWDELAAHPYFLQIASMRPAFADAFTAALENIKLLRREFEFEVLHPGRSLAALMLNPFPEKPTIYIYSDKPGTECKFSIWDGDAFTDKTTVAQERLISTVYDYMEKLKGLKL